MSLMRYDPFGDLVRVRESMDQWFEEMFGGRRRRRREEGGMEILWMPPAEIFQEDSQVIVRLEAPGVDPASVDVNVTQDTITVRGQTHREEERRERNYYLREIWGGRFSRTLRLPARVQSDQAKAAYANGMLEVRIPVAEEARPKTVKVEMQGQPQELPAGRSR